MMHKVILLLLAILLFLFMAFVGGRLPAFLFYVYLSGLVLPFLHGIYGRVKLKGEITIAEQELIAGEEVLVTSTFKNPSKMDFPRLEYSNSLSALLSGKAATTQNFHLERDTTFVDHTNIICRRRGIYTLNQTELLIKDIFDLFTFKKTIQAPVALKIYPRNLALENLSIESGIQLGDLIVDDPLFQDYTAINALREYSEGDSVKKIHWRASAKHEKLIVKDFEFRGDTEVLLILNASEKDYRKDSHRLIEDRVVETAVSITDFCLRKQLSIRYVYRDHDHFIETEGAKSNMIKLFLEAFIGFKVEEKLPFYQVIQKMSPSISQGTSLIVISPTIGKELATTLVDLRMKNIRPMVFLIHSQDQSKAEDDEQLLLARTLIREKIPVSKISL